MHREWELLALPRKPVHPISSRYLLSLRWISVLAPQRNHSRSYLIETPHSVIVRTYLWNDIGEVEGYLSSHWWCIISFHKIIPPRPNERWTFKFCTNSYFISCCQICMWSVCTNFLSQHGLLTLRHRVLRNHNAWLLVYHQHSLPSEVLCSLNGINSHSTINLKYSWI